MTATLRRRISNLAVLGLLGLCLSYQSASAALVGTEQVISEQQLQQERERVKAFLDRGDTVKQLQAMGIAPQTAQRRVDAMTDEEVHRVAGMLQTLPAGGDFTNFQMIVIALLIAIVLVLVL